MPGKPQTYSQLRGVPEIFSIDFDHAIVVKNGLNFVKIILNFINVNILCSQKLIVHYYLQTIKYKPFKVMFRNSTEFDLRIRFRIAQIVRTSHWEAINWCSWCNLTVHWLYKKVRNKTIFLEWYFISVLRKPLERYLDVNGPWYTRKV